LELRRDELDEGKKVSKIKHQCSMEIEDHPWEGGREESRSKPYLKKHKKKILLMPTNRAKTKELTST